MSTNVETIASLQSLRRAGRGGRAALLGELGYHPILEDSVVAAYRADVVTLTAAELVSSWTDLSGHGRHLVQATGTKQPPWSANGGPKSTPCIGPFDNTDDFLRAAFTLPQPIYLVLVVKPSASNAHNGTMVDGATGNTLRLYVRVANTIAINAGTADVNAPEALKENAWQRVVAEFDGTFSALRVTDGGRPTGAPGTPGPDGLCLGTFGDQASDPSDMMIAELIVLSAFPTDVRDRIRSYCVDRYGV